MPRWFLELDRRKATALAGCVVAFALLAGGLWIAAGPGSRPASVVPPRSTASIAAYRGLASWIDLYDTKAWNHPETTVSDMASHGVRTIMLETASSGSASAIVHREASARIIELAHARGMKVVAWYLPTLVDPELDLDRASQAIRFTTGGGQRFDSFALDIESTKVATETVRNARLVALSDRLRTLAGATYPLGAIIPSPVGLEGSKSRWRDFPYGRLAARYDVFLPMHYYTFDITSPQKTYTSTLANERVLRQQPGCATVPIHMIGGIAGKSSVEQVRQFARAVARSGCIGASLYDWAGMSSSRWKALAPIVDGGAS